MKQSEATATRPFYSVSYKYKGGCAIWSIIHYNGITGKTMSGTDAKELAIKTADECLKMPHAIKAFVSVTTDYCKHKRIYETK